MMTETHSARVHSHGVNIVTVRLDDLLDKPLCAQDHGELRATVKDRGICGLVVDFLHTAEMNIAVLSGPVHLTAFHDNTRSRGVGHLGRLAEEWVELVDDVEVAKPAGRSQRRS